jgi:hypothetical protein
MTSFHRLIAVVVIWAGVAFAAFGLFGSQFLYPLPIVALISLTALLVGGATVATVAIVRSPLPSH